jgi:hypothetical protein
MDDLESIKPVGIFSQVVLWNCQCGNTRAVDIENLPQELIRKAMEADEMRKRSVGFGAAG